GARLSASLRRRLVNGYPLGRLPVGAAIERGPAVGPSALCRLSNHLCAKPDAEPEHGGTRLALCRRLAARRSDAPVDAARERTVRANTATAERRAASSGRALEVRLQRDQVNRQDHAHERSAADDLEFGRFGRIRFLLECQPERGSSALESEAGAAHRRVWPARHTALQRLCGSSRAALFRDGFKSLLLMAMW